MSTTRGWPHRHLPGLAAMWRLAAAAGLGAALLAGCGGSSDDSGSTQASATVTAGTIEGFDSGTSIVVNGLVFDSASAAVVDDDDRSSSRSALKLGMEVEIQSARAATSSRSASATKIAFSSALVGLVDAVNTDASQLTVIGQTVQVSSGTVFGDDFADGLASVTVGSILKVYGIFDASTGITTATRIELKASVDAFRLRGVVSALDTTARTMQIGGQLVSFANVADAALPSGLADGSVVRAVVATTQVDGAWVASRIKAERRFVEDGSNVDIDGVVTRFTSQTSFELCGLVVDATNATFVNEAALAKRARVNVTGALVDGVLVATTVTVRDSASHGKVTLSGAISALDTTALTFVVNETTVSYSSSTNFVNGAEADLADGLNVKVKGSLSSDGTTVVASRITFK